MNRALREALEAMSDPELAMARGRAKAELMDLPFGSAAYTDALEAWNALLTETKLREIRRTRGNQP